jgi:hypothetical protein
MAAIGVYAKRAREGHLLGLLPVRVVAPKTCCADELSNWLRFMGPPSPRALGLLPRRRLIARIAFEPGAGRRALQKLPTGSLARVSL